MTDLSQLRGREGASETENIHRRGGHLCLVVATGRLGSHMHSCRQEAQRAWTFVISLVLVPALVIAAHPHSRILMFPVHSHAAASVWLLSALPQESLSHYSHILHLSKCPEKTGMWTGRQQPRWTKSLRVTLSPGL